jgi:hypothetical protein
MLFIFICKFDCSVANNGDPELKKTYENCVTTLRKLRTRHIALATRLDSRTASLITFMCRAVISFECFVKHLAVVRLHLCSEYSQL